MYGCLHLFLGKKIKVCEVTTTHFVVTNTILMTSSNPSKPDGLKEFAPSRQGLISLNSFHLYLLYFDPCHNLSAHFPTFVFTHCTFVVSRLKHLMLLQE
jgi:hypothetical protein